MEKAEQWRREGGQRRAPPTILLPDATVSVGHMDGPALTYPRNLGEVVKFSLLLGWMVQMTIGVPCRFMNAAAGRDGSGK